MPPPSLSRLTSATYTLSEAAALAGVSGQTVSNWFRGRAGSSQTPLFADRLRSRTEAVRLSFLEVSEAIVAGLLREHGASIARIRVAREFTRRHIECEHPFATQRFKLSSRRILLELESDQPTRRRDDVLVDFSEQAGHRVLPLYFTAALENFDFLEHDEADWARRYFPYGRQVPLVIDPRFGSGRLTLEDTNVRAESVFARIDHGYSAEDITDDLSIPVELVQAVFEFKRAA